MKKGRELGGRDEEGRTFQTSEDTWTQEMEYLFQGTVRKPVSLGHRVLESRGRGVWMPNRTLYLILEMIATGVIEGRGVGETLSVLCLRRIDSRVKWRMV